MFRFWEKYSVSNVRVTSGCQLSCGFCDLWKKEPEISELSRLITTGTYYDVYPRTRWVNLYGGDPFMYDDLRFILSFYQSEGVKVRLWTNGVVSLNAVAEVADVVAEVQVYIPSVCEEDYGLVTGHGSIQEVRDAIRMFKSEKVAIGIHCPVSDSNIGDLPDIHDFAYDLEVPLVFHRGKVSLLNKEQKRLLSRYRRVKGVGVRVDDSLNNHSCKALPTINTHFLACLWDDLVFRCRNQNLI